MVKDANTEQRIIEAARRVFMKKGMVGARMQEISDEAGINKSLLHYFGEYYPKPNCGACDNCLNPKEKFEGKEERGYLAFKSIQTAN